MPEYLHPGVYIEETSFRAKPIEGVSTSTAGLVGRTRKGPEGRATLVTSFTQFVRDYGDPYPAPTGLGDYLGHAVRAFFENGGRRAYIVRALAPDAQGASSTSQVELGTVARLPSTATVIGPTQIIPLVSLRNIEIGTQLEIWARGGTAPRFTRVVTDYNASRNSVTLNAPLPAGVTLHAASTYLYVVGVPPQGAVHAPGPVAHARYRGGSGNDIGLEMRPVDSPPTRLTTRAFARSRPIVTSFAGTGPGANASTFNLAPDEAAQLRVGDTIAFSDGVARTITAISDGWTLDLSAPTAARGAGTLVQLVQRGGSAAPSPITVYTLAAGETIAAGSTIAVPHGVAAALQTGDVIQFDGDAASRCTVTGRTAATPATITFDPALTATEDFSTSILRLVSASGPTTRLVVSDTSSLATPYGASFAPIALSDGSHITPSAIQLVDTSTNQIYVAGGSYDDAWTSFELLEVAAAGDTTLPVSSTGGFYTGAIVEVDDGSTKHYSVVTGVDPGNRLVTLADPLAASIVLAADSSQRRAYVRVLEMDVLVYERDPASGKALLKETFTGLTWNDNPDTQSAARYYVDRINDLELGSKLITIEAPSAPTLGASGQPTTVDGFLTYLSGGDDGSALSPIDLIGSDNGPNQRFGIQSLSERRDIALVAVPGVTDEVVQQALITHCELLRYRFAVLDGRMNQPDVTDILAHRNGYDSAYAAYYAPWFTTVDLTTGKTLTVPPSGYVLGICARVDNERGVFKAPANEVVRGILGVELPFTDGEQDVLNPVGVNLTREFEARGIRVWGARTLSSDSEWKYVNVKRLFIFLEHSIDDGTQWIVFEPNNEALWARVKATIESFLFGVWKTGALMGTKPDDAYFVRCDRTTMTQDDIDNGRLVCLIGIAPTYPAEFVIFRIGQFTASSNVS